MKEYNLTLNVVPSAHQMSDIRKYASNIHGHKNCQVMVKEHTVFTRTVVIHVILVRVLKKVSVPIFEV